MQNNTKKIILILTIIILIFGIFFGYKFYQNSKQITPDTGLVNKDQNRTPFQTRSSTSTNVNTIIEGNTDIENPTDNTVKEKVRLIQLWKEPVSGFDFVYKDIETISTSTDFEVSINTKNIQNKKILKNQEFIYLWDRKTGHIYENLASTTDINKISNYTSPGAEEVYFSDSSSLIVRTLSEDNETISTKYIKLTKNYSTSTVYSASATDLKIDSNNISFLGSIKKIFYFLNRTGSGTTSNIDGSNRLSVVNTSVSEWLSQYVNKSIITLTTKPSGYFKGYLFVLSTSGDSKNAFILGEKYGFNTLMSPDGKKVIYNEILNDVLETFIYDIKSKSSTYLTQATIVDKCVWSADSKKVFCGIPQQLKQAPYPDAWYKNEVSFADNIWSIDVETGDFDLVVPLQDQVVNPIDIYSIKISNNNKYLLFQDKNTLTLWKYEI